VSRVLSECFEAGEWAERRDMHGDLKLQSGRVAMGIQAFASRGAQRLIDAPGQRIHGMQRRSRGEGSHCHCEWQRPCVV
jgi:hypothetical protein